MSGIQANKLTSFPNPKKQINSFGKPINLEIFYVCSEKRKKNVIYEFETGKK